MSKHLIKNEPIFYVEGKGWFHFDETLTEQNAYGPYQTREYCEEELAKYRYYLNIRREQWNQFVT